MLGDNVLEISKPKDPTVVGTGLGGKPNCGPKAIAVKLSGYVKLVTSFGKSTRGRTIS